LDCCRKNEQYSYKKKQISHFKHPPCLGHESNSINVIKLKCVLGIYEKLKCRFFCVKNLIKNSTWMTWKICSKVKVGVLLWQHWCITIFWTYWNWWYQIFHYFKWRHKKPVM